MDFGFGIFGGGFVDDQELQFDTHSHYQHDANKMPSGLENQMAELSLHNNLSYHQPAHQTYNGYQDNTSKSNNRLDDSVSRYEALFGEDVIDINRGGRQTSYRNNRSFNNDNRYSNSHGYDYENGAKQRVMQSNSFMVGHRPLNLYNEEDDYKPIQTSELQ